MTTDDVHENDMAHPELSDEQLAALLDGSSEAPAGHPVADALLRARRELGAAPVPTPGAALSEYLGVGRVTDPIPPSAVDGDLVEVTPSSEPASRRVPVLASLSTLVGTVTGKILVGTTVAAASLTGAHAAGIVDLPGLPDVDDSAITETLDDQPDDITAIDLDRIDPDRNDLGVDDAAVEADADGDLSEADSADDSPPADTKPADDDLSDDADTSAHTGNSEDPAHSAVEDSSSTSDDADEYDDSDRSDDDDHSDDDAESTVSTTTSAPNSAVPSTPITKVYGVDGVGTTTVTVSDGQISLVSAVPATGWTLDEAGPDDNGIESTYSSGDLETRIDFEIDDGRLRVRVREENDATDVKTERIEYFPL